MEITLETKKKRKRMVRSPEFYALCRRARRLPVAGSGRMSKTEKAKLLAENPDAILPPEKIAAPAPKPAPLPQMPRAPANKHYRHAMTRDKRTNEWRVRVPSPKGRTRYVTTGQTDVKEALKVVDASGVPQLSVLARARCLTQNAASIILAGRDKTCAEVAKVWLRDLVLDQSANTCRMYEIYMNSFFATNDCANKQPSFITREMIHAFVNAPDKKHNTRRSRLSAVVSFYRHAAGFGHVTGNIASTIRINLSAMTIEQRQALPAVPFTKAEYRRIMACPEISEFWRMATALGYWLGLRMVDVCKLERASIGEDFAVLYPHKTGRQLVLPIHDPAIGSGELKEVFTTLLAATPEGQLLCFPELSGMYDRCSSNLSNQFVQEIKKAGIYGKSFHGLRHSFRLRLSGLGRPIEEVSALMGHASTQTTKGYGRTITAPSSLPPPCAEDSPSGAADFALPASGGSGIAESQTA